jgi:hypothetical protein
MMRRETHLQNIGNADVRVLLRKKMAKPTAVSDAKSS